MIGRRGEIPIQQTPPGGDGVISCLLHDDCRERGIENDGFRELICYKRAIGEVTLRGYLVSPNECANF